MDKETLSNYGWVVCVILVLAIMISLATPFGSVIRDKVAGTVENFKNNSEEVLDNIGGAASFDDLGGGGSGGAGGAGNEGGAGGGEPVCEHVDANTDYHCDECGNVIPHTCQYEEWQNPDYEGEYDTLISVCSLCDAHDCKYNPGYCCWYCDELMEHNCNEFLCFNGEIAYCDICGNEIPHDHVDEDADCYCDECYSDYHADADGNYRCDNCDDAVGHTCESADYDPSSCILCYKTMRHEFADWDGYGTCGWCGSDNSSDGYHW